MTESEISSVGSFPSLGAMVGTAVAGVLINRIGRQKGGVVLCLPAIVSLKSFIILINCLRGDHAGLGEIPVWPTFDTLVSLSVISGIYYIYGTRLYVTVPILTISRSEQLRREG